MIVSCPYCGKTITVNGLGRKPLNIPLKNICEALRKKCNVNEAAQELGCSPAYIFGVLKANGLRQKDVINDKQPTTRLGCG